MLERSPRGIRLDKQASSDITKEGPSITRFVALKNVRRFVLFIILNNLGLTKREVKKLLSKVPKVSRGTLIL